MIDKEVIKKNFSRCARYYDRYSTIQNLCASELIAKIETNNLNRILDIGCGTGNYTKLLRARFPQARIKAIDISLDMVKIAKEKLPDEMVEFIIADGETANFNQRFDFVSSNASFQWFAGLEKALRKYKRLLNKGGIISFSIFGPLSFTELDKSLKELFGKDTEITAGTFFNKARLERILKSLFRKIAVEQKIYKERYASLPQLLKKIKYTGARGSGDGQGIVWSAKALNDLEKIYKEKFKEIIATYEVLFCRGIK